MSEAPWRATLDGVAIACRLTPKGGRDAIDGAATLSDGMRVLLVRVRSAAEDGLANEALCKLLAAKLAVPPRASASSRGRRAASSRSPYRAIRPPSPRA